MVVVIVDVQILHIIVDVLVVFLLEIVHLLGLRHLKTLIEIFEAFQNRHFQDLGGGGSFSGLVLETGQNDFFVIGVEGRFKGDFLSFDVVELFVDRLVGEGYFFVRHFVKEDADAPDVYFFGLFFVVHDFWREVLFGAAEGLAHQVGAVGRTEAEIAEFEI